MKYYCTPDGIKAFRNEVFGDVFAALDDNSPGYAIEDSYINIKIGDRSIEIPSLAHFYDCFDAFMDALEESAREDGY